MVNRPVEMRVIVNAKDLCSYVMNVRTGEY